MCIEHLSVGLPARVPVEMSLSSWGSRLDHQDELVSLVVMIVVTMMVMMMVIAKLLVTQGASFDHQNELVRLRRADE